MRIQLLTHSFGPEISPPQRRWTTFVKTFLAMDVDVDVVAPNRRGRETWRPYSTQEQPEPPGRFNLYTFPFRLSAVRWHTKVLCHFAMVLIMIPKSLCAPRPDILIATVPALPTLIAGYLISKIRRVPLVVEMRDAWPELLVESGVIRWKFAERICVKAIRWIQSSASLVIAVTPGHAQRLVADGLLDVGVVSNGYSFSSLANTRVPHALDSAKLRVLYLGNLGESQGLEEVVDIAAVSQDWMELRIVGRGSASTRLKSRATELGLLDIFVPPVQGEQVLDWYDWADTCVVSLRTDWDSFAYTVPSKLFELAGYGCHITGLVTGEAAEIIDKFDLGISSADDVLTVSRLLRESVSEIKEWEFDPQSMETFRSHYDLESLAADYYELLTGHLVNLREGRA